MTGRTTAKAFSRFLPVLCPIYVSKLILQMWNGSAFVRSGIVESCEPMRDRLHLDDSATGKAFSALQMWLCRRPPLHEMPTTVLVRYEYLTLHETHDKYHPETQAAKHITERHPFPSTSSWLALSLPYYSGLSCLPSLCFRGNCRAVLASEGQKGQVAVVVANNNVLRLPQFAFSLTTWASLCTMSWNLTKSKFYICVLLDDTNKTR